jgi:predicted alpha/beta-fold hydrolase
MNYENYFTNTIKQIHDVGEYYKQSSTKNFMDL